MKYQFPTINHISEIQAAIRGRDEFICADRGDHLIFNYLVNFADSFPDPMSVNDPETARMYALRRECRGLTFSKATGQVIRRPYHKFFNAGEKEETRIERIPVQHPHRILEKLDGSMLVPFYSEGRLRFGTKMGITEVAGPAEEFARRNNSIWEFSQNMVGQGYTPIFEWCSRQQRIIIDYPVDRMVLTAVRNMVTGQYWTYEELRDMADAYGIEVVSALDGNIENMEAFVNQTREILGAEGYVFRFNGGELNGQMGKVKADDYVLLHKTMDLVKWEKDLLAMILRDRIDDALAVMPEDMKARVQQYSDDVFRAIAATAERLRWVVIAARDNLRGSKKRFALETVAQHPIASERALLFSIWDHGEDAADEIVKKVILDNTSTQTKLHGVRHLFGGHNWNDYHKVVVEEE